MIDPTRPTPDEPDEAADSTATPHAKPFRNQQLLPAPASGPQASAKQQRRAGKIPAKEHARRIGIIVKLLGQRLVKRDIKRFCSEQFGVGHRTAERYLARARAILIERSGRPREEFVGEAVEFYEAIIRTPDDKMDLSFKMRAQESLERLLGLNAPSKVSLTSPDGKQTYHEHVYEKLAEQMSDEELRVLRKLRLQAGEIAKQQDDQP